MVTTHKKRIGFYGLAFLVSSYMLLAFMEGKSKVEILNSCDAADSLMLLVELKSTFGGNYKAKDDCVEILRQYARHMENRRSYFLLQSPFLLQSSLFYKNVAKELERVADDLEQADPLNAHEAHEAIEKALKSIAEFLIYNRLLQQTDDVKTVKG